MTMHAIDERKGSFIFIFIFIFIEGLLVRRLSIVGIGNYWHNSRMPMLTQVASRQNNASNLMFHLPSRQKMRRI
jgi:hypothetical protein